MKVHIGDIIVVPEAHPGSAGMLKALCKARGKEGSIILLNESQFDCFEQCRFIATREGEKTMEVEYESTER